MTAVRAERQIHLLTQREVHPQVWDDGFRAGRVGRVCVPPPYVGDDAGARAALWSRAHFRGVMARREAQRDSA